MKSILEDLYMGKINVMESMALKNWKSIPEEDSFVESLTPEQQVLFEKVLDAFMDQWAADNMDCFIKGFKMAVKILVDSLTEL